jgi:hypothetical protein
MDKCRPLSPQRRPGIILSVLLLYLRNSFMLCYCFFFQFLAVSRVLPHGADRILLHPIAVDHVREVDLYNPGGLGLGITQGLAHTYAHALPIVKGPRMIDPEVDHKYPKLKLITPKSNPGQPAQSPSKSKQATPL